MSPMLPMLLVLPSPSPSNDLPFYSLTGGVFTSNPFEDMNKQWDALKQPQRKVGSKIDRQKNQAK
jgi:hypothetical protein